MYELNCITCGYSWQSHSGDVIECPVCESKDIVVVEKNEGEG